MIKSVGDEWVLYSQDGTKELFRSKNKSEVLDMEKQISHFASKAEIDIVLKATLGDDGVMRWKSSVSTTALDRQEEKTSIELYNSWIDAIENGTRKSWLPPARNPFLGVAHYPSLEGKSEAGSASVVYVDGKCCKAKGTFNDNPIGKAVFESLRKEQALAQKGEAIEQPIRISAAWYDEMHKHTEEDFIFERKSLTDKCPLCEKGVKGKVYLKGQLDHFAATRVPVNPETSLNLEEKSMHIVTRKGDAASIIGEDLAEILETEVKMIGKSEAIVVKSIGGQSFDLGDFLIVENKDDVSTWHLPVKRQGKVDIELMGAAKAALTTNLISKSYVQDATNKLKELYLKENLQWEVKSLPTKTENKMNKPDKKINGVVYSWDEDAEMYLDPDGNELPVSKPFAKKKAVVVEDEDEEEMDGEEEEVPAPKKKAKVAKSLVSYAEAKSLAEENDLSVSVWDVFKSAAETAFESKDAKVQLLAIKGLIDEFDEDVKTIKSQVANAYLGYIEQKSDVVEDPNDITLQLKAQVDAAFDSDLDKAGKEQAIQKSLTEYVGKLKNKLGQTPVAKSNTADVEQLIDQKLTPVMDRLNSLVDQLAQKSQVQAGIPVQKSMTATANMAVENNLPVSSVTGKPSALTAMIQRSLG